MTDETIRQLDAIASQLSATLLSLDPDDVDDDFERTLRAIADTLSSFHRRRRQDREQEQSMTPTGDSLDVFERRHIEQVLRRCQWRINGKGNAAERLNLHPNTLRFRMKKLGLVRPAQRRDD